MPFPSRARAYLWSMALAGLGALAYWAWEWHGPAPTNIGLVVFLAALAAFAQHFPLPIGPRHKVDASSAVYFAALLLFGMPVAVGLVGVSRLGGGSTLALRRNPVSGKRMRTPRSVVFNAGQLMLATGLAGLVYYTILPQSAPAPLERLANLWALPLAAAALYLVNTLAVSTMAGLQLGQRPLELWLAGQRVRALQSIAIFLAGLGTALISAHYAWGPLALLVPAALVYLSLKRTVQLVEQAQRREREAALLAEAGRLFNASLELPATLGAVVDLTGRALGDSCDLFLLVADQEELHPAACYHADADECARRRARYQA